MEIALHEKNAEFVERQTAVVLLPPFPFDHRIWQEVTRRLEGVPVLSIDPPGFGKSPSTTDTPSVENYADYVAQAIRTRGVTKALVCGNSYGGYVSLALLERHARLISGLVLVGTNAQFDAPEQRAKRTEMAIAALVGRGPEMLLEGLPNLVADRTEETNPALYAQLREWISEAPAEGIAWAQRAMASRTGRLGVLERSQLPALVLRGEQDRASSSAQAEEMAKALRTRVVNVPRAGHLLPVDDPGAVVRAIMSVYHRCEK